MENVSIEWVQDECSDLLMTIEELESAELNIEEENSNDEEQD